MQKLEDIDLDELMQKLKNDFPDGFIDINNEVIYKWLKMEVGGDIIDDVLDLMLDLKLVWISSFYVNMENSEAWRTTVEIYCWKDIDEEKLRIKCNNDIIGKLVRFI